MERPEPGNDRTTRLVTGWDGWIVHTDTMYDDDDDDGEEAASTEIWENAERCGPNMMMGGPLYL